MLREMQAVHLFAQGKHGRRLAQMDRATLLQGRMPKPIGRPFPVKGADELYGELLLEAGRPQAAVEWFNKALIRTPNRSRAVLGLARARAKAGDAAGSRKAYEQLSAELAERGPECAGAEGSASRVGALKGEGLGLES